MEEGVVGCGGRRSRPQESYFQYFVSSVSAFHLSIIVVQQQHHRTISTFTHRTSTSPLVFATSIRLHFIASESIITRPFVFASSYISSIPCDCNTHLSSSSFRASFREQWEEIHFSFSLALITRFILQAPLRSSSEHGATWRHSRGELISGPLSILRLS